ncbi:PaaI family thioesterase [Bradyrhizobium nitroreducens]|uniref:PaaI family thioesterase n=1 Tax=Bradyrhizobium nitroreducens TaxID=709803 RepID=UPI000C1E2B50|nr:PaaI family thioesterase [Bradyrhizobium nitroreducens]
MSHSERIKQLATRRSPAWTLLGVGAIAYDKILNRVVIEWNAEQRHCHSVEGHPRGGIVQGGVVTGWLDVAMATACLVSDERTIAVASLEIKVSFLLPAHPGLHRSYGTVIRHGRSIGFMEAELRDSSDVLVARASSTAALRVQNGVATSPV